jgi:uncharacterized protein YaeQ
VYAVDVALSDVDRGVYAALPLKVAQHPSETESYLITRILAYALEYEEGIAFTQGLSTADEPAVWVRDLTGALRAWIEVGTPSVERLHKASKACDRVVVYCHKDAPAYLRTLVGQRVYARDRVTIVEIDRAFVDALAARLDRRTAIDLSVTEGTLYVDMAGESLSTNLVRHAFPG